MRLDEIVFFIGTMPGWVTILVLLAAGVAGERSYGGSRKWYDHAIGAAGGVVILAVAAVTVIAAALNRR